MNEHTELTLAAQRDYQQRTADGHAKQAESYEREASKQRAAEQAARDRVADLDRALAILRAVDGEGAAGESSEPTGGEAPAA